MRSRIIFMEKELINRQEPKTQRKKKKEKKKPYVYTN